MKTVLIIYSKQFGDVRKYTLGRLTGPAARTEVIEFTDAAHIPRKDLCHTPKVVGGIRFYIAVGR